jgi:tRNA pseudouridine38-40 synthase
VNGLERTGLSPRPAASRDSAAQPGDPRSWYRLDLAYDGTDFRGWAKQPGRRTVEGVLEEALAVALRERVRLSVAGRTDAGVHALAQVASFATRAESEPERLLLTLNALLPPDVAVQNVARAADGFAARAARARTYRYRLWLPTARPVFEARYVWDVRGAVDLERLRECARLLVGRRDFAALSPSARFYHTCVREVTAAAWSLAEDGNEAVFEISAGSFLHMMVRVAVGSMVEVAQGRLPLSRFEERLANCERAAMGRTAPARGLALVAVRYS